MYYFRAYLIMKILKIWNDNPSEKQIQEISNFIENGELAILPTDSMYAICCDALNVKAIDRLCRIKGINPDKTNLSIICADISMASKYAKIDNRGFEILKSYTPGPFTFLFKALSSLPRAFKGRKIIGIRIPNSNVALSISKYLDKPLLVTSIEYADEDYAINPELIAESYESQVDVMVDDGDGDTSPSTIVDCMENPPVVIREGKGIL